jgi:hypothetical protein
MQGLRVTRLKILLDLADPLDKSSGGSGGRRGSKNGVCGIEATIAGIQGAKGMLSGSWNLFRRFILVSLVLVLTNYGCVVAQRQGSSRQVSSGPGLWDFLPKAPTIAKYEGTRVYPDGSTSQITHTSYLIRISEKGSEHLVRTYEEEEKTALGPQLNEVSHIALVSANITKRGVIAQLKERIIYNPPWVLMQWPLRKGDTWEQKVLFRVETETAHISSVVRGEEIIHTSVGKVRTWRIEQTVREDKEKFIYWWTRGKWLVKWQSEGRENTSLEIVEFKEPVR